MGETNFDSESIITITQNKLKLLIISSIHTEEKQEKMW